MNKGFFKTIVCSLIINCTAAQAQSPFYLSVGGGGVFSNSSSQYLNNSSGVIFAATSIGTSYFIMHDVNWQDQFNNGFDLNIGAGMHMFEHWRADMEFVYQNIRRSQFGSYTWTEDNSLTGRVFAQQPGEPIGSNNNRAHLFSLLTNAAYDFKNTSQWTPFVGTGIGISWLSSNRIETKNTLSINLPNIPLFSNTPTIEKGPELYGTAFVWQFKAGISHDLSPDTSLSLQYRLMATTRFRANASEIITNPGIDGAESHFSIAPHDISGLLTQAVELSARFNV